MTKVEPTNGPDDIGSGRSDAIRGDEDVDGMCLPLINQRGNWPAADVV
jgi:hypothetical protein